MQLPFSYFYLNGIQYRVLEGGIFEMDAGNGPKRKVADYLEKHRYAPQK
ncbi:MAG: hypothetical protein RQ757_11425 [Pseudomonadales bacterium]|nr:hypothetical protein [Pseudomonadales bacterium]